MKYTLLGICVLGWSCLHAQFITNNGVTIRNSANVTVNGSWTNTSGTVIYNDGSIRTNNSFINEGVLDKGSRGRFFLNYTTDHDFQPGGGNLRVLIKQGLGNALVTGSLNISDSLLLYSGLIELTSAFDTISLGSNAYLHADTGAHVIGGLFARAGAGKDLIFPLGKDGHYLPLKLYGVNAARVTASVEDAPLDYVKGPRLDSLIDFPYRWRVLESTDSDTASYVEVSFPGTLITSSTGLVVAREIPVKTYAGMGARSVSDQYGEKTIKSYERRLRGVYTVAKGQASQPATDSLALVALYQTTQGPSWNNHTNWLTGNLDTWFGITLTEQGVTDVGLKDNNLNGSVSDQLADIVTLQKVDLSGNQITWVPDFSNNNELAFLDVSNNKLDFSSLEPNANVTGFSYLGQSEFGTATDTTVSAGTYLTISASAGGNSSKYRWTRNGVTVKDSTYAMYEIPAVTRATMGEYAAVATNPNLPGLSLQSRSQKVLAHADIRGKLLVDSTVVATKGEMTLYRIQPGGFAVVESVPVGNDGTFEFKNVILDNYQLRGFADTVVYPLALPTYFVRSTFWEAADTISLEANTTGLDVLSIIKPSFSGDGTIAGTLYEEAADGRVKENIPIANAGVSAHFVEQKDDKEVLTLVAYAFTQADGSFLLKNLPHGDYRLNIQYPGYPMDETSFITASIGDEESLVVVEAAVVEGKIQIQKRAITGIISTEGYHASVYPNPVVGKLVVRMPSDGARRTVSLSDISGKSLSSLTTHAAEAEINVSAIRPGMYWIQIQTGRQRKTLRILIER